MALAGDVRWIAHRMLGNGPNQSSDRIQEARRSMATQVAERHDRDRMKHVSRCTRSVATSQLGEVILVAQDTSHERLDMLEAYFSTSMHKKILRP